MRRAILFLTILLCCPIGSRACTSAVISGKATADGRPLLWKNRDTDHLQNSVKYFAGGRYAFIGIVNSRAKHPEGGVGRAEQCRLRHHEHAVV